MKDLKLEDSIYKIFYKNPNSYYEYNDELVIKVGEFFYPWAQVVSYNVGGAEDSVWDGYDYVVPYARKWYDVDRLIAQIKSFSEKMNYILSEEGDYKLRRIYKISPIEKINLIEHAAFKYYGESHTFPAKIDGKVSVVAVIRDKIYISDQVQIFKEVTISSDDIVTLNLDK